MHEAKKYTDRLLDLDGNKIYGVYWNKGSVPTLTRTHDAIGMTAEAGIDNSFVQNDFDSAQIFREIGKVTDTLGNTFIRIPKFYIRKTDGVGFKTVQISKTKYTGFYLPWCFWDFTNSLELPYIDVGKHKASLGAGNKLQSIPEVYPLSNTHIVNMRTYAKNNNAGGLLGYQQLDVHAVDVIRTLMLVEFATLDIQTVMKGYSVGRYSADDKAVAETVAGNNIVVTNTTGAYYKVGQTISIHLAGAAIAGLPNIYGRTITAINADTPEAGKTTIAFDGDPVNIAVNDFMLNTGWKNGFSSAIAASSGTIVANDGKYPCSYRGIESPFGDMWQFADGININNRQAWITKNAEDYASNVFASPYEVLSYSNAAADGYVKEMGFDPNNPYAEFPTLASGAGEDTYYSDYYYQAAGQLIARFGGWLDMVRCWFVVLV